MSADDCDLCWGTGYVPEIELDNDGNEYGVDRPCPNGCLAPGEVPF